MPGDASSPPATPGRNASSPGQDARGLPPQPAPRPRAPSLPQAHRCDAVGAQSDPDRTRLPRPGHGAMGRAGQCAVLPRQRRAGHRACDPAAARARHSRVLVQRPDRAVRPLRPSDLVRHSPRPVAGACAFCGHAHHPGYLGRRGRPARCAPPGPRDRRDSSPATRFASSFR